MSVTFKSFLNESINDKGLFKAVFVIGLPGSGKSYTTKRLSGVISPKIINTDRAVEFISNKKQIISTSQNWDSDFKDVTTRITLETLKNYINGMLPLFIDGTSNNLSNIQHRIGILESLGYDVGIIHIKVDLDTALRRIEARNDNIKRHVDVDFVKKVFSQDEENAKYLMAKVDFSKSIDNTQNILDDVMMKKVFTSTQNFFTSKIVNPIGTRSLEILQKSNTKYLVPEVINENILNKKLEGWYKE